MAKPTMTPAANNHGFVPSLPSAQYPSTVNPTVGTNIRQVVSAMVKSIKFTAEGGVFDDEGSSVDGLLI